MESSKVQSESTSNNLIDKCIQECVSNENKEVDVVCFEKCAQREYMKLNPLAISTNENPSDIQKESDPIQIKTYKDYNTKPTRWKLIGEQNYEEIPIKTHFSDTSYNYYLFGNKIDNTNTYGFQVSITNPEQKREIILKSNGNFAAYDADAENQNEFEYPAELQNIIKNVYKDNKPDDAKDTNQNPEDKEYITALGKLKQKISYDLNKLKKGFEPYSENQKSSVLIDCISTKHNNIENYIKNQLLDGLTIACNDKSILKELEIDTKLKNIYVETEALYKIIVSMQEVEKIKKEYEEFSKSIKNQSYHTCTLQILTNRLRFLYDPKTKIFDKKAVACDSLQYFLNNSEKKEINLLKLQSFEEKIFKLLNSSQSEKLEFDNTINLGNYWGTMNLSDMNWLDFQKKFEERNKDDSKAFLSLVLRDILHENNNGNFLKIVNFVTEKFLDDFSKIKTEDGLFVLEYILLYSNDVRNLVYNNKDFTKDPNDKKVSNILLKLKSKFTEYSDAYNNLDLAEYKNKYDEEIAKVIKDIIDRFIKNMEQEVSAKSGEGNEDPIRITNPIKHSWKLNILLVVIYIYRYIVPISLITVALSLIIIITGKKKNANVSKDKDKDKKESRIKKGKK